VAELAVSCRGVTKAFGEGPSRTLALRGVDLDVRLGELTYLVGPSGCGKTTLLCVIAGLLDKTAGEVRVLGQDDAGWSDRRRTLFRREHLGFVFQQYNLLPSLTAAENVAVPLLARGTPRREAVAHARELLGRLGMASRADALPAQLSGGQQQRVALGRAVIHGPRLVVADEPTSALDAASGLQVMELLIEVAVRPDRAVIVVTHDDRIYRFADAIARMEDGRVASLERTRSKEIA
jgi:putative ABC transport system ATP-binding protein